MKTVRVTAPARLHLGMFDLSGSLGRLFGGLGVAISKPAVMVEASPGDQLSAQGPDADRALEFARRYLAATGLRTGAHLRVEQAIPAHVGLGSGTKLGLTVAQALATLYDQPTEPYALARAVGRGERSAVGLWTFAQGGFVVEGGHRPEHTTPAPLLMRQPMPAEWSCVIAIPDQFTGLSGRAEAAAFEQLVATAEQAARIAHVVLMSLLPALVEQQLVEFGTALTQVQKLVGDCFSPVQGGRFSNSRSAALIEAFLRWGAAGAGQSSWGPTVYGLVSGQAQGRHLANLAKEMIGESGQVDLVAFDNRGVRVETTS